MVISHSKKDNDSFEVLNGEVKRRRLLGFGTLVTALGGVSALTGPGVSEANAAPGDKTQSTAYVPLSEKGVASGVATLDPSAKIPPAQLPDFSATFTIVVNAKSPEYGVVGDGITDDSGAIQALFNSVGPNTTIHFPAGTYKHSNLVITRKSNFALVGDGAVFVATSRSQPYLSFVECTDFAIRGITSKGAVAEVRQGPTRGISLVGCGRFIVDSCHVFDTEGVGIYVGRVSGTTGCYDGRIVGNLVHDTRADGIHITGASTRIAVLGNTVRDTGDDSIAVVSYGTDINGPCEDIAITGNVTLHSCSRGLAVVGGKAITLAGNTIRDPRNAGIYIAYEPSYSTRPVENVTVSGNTIRGANTFNPLIQYAAIQVVGDGGTTTPVVGITITGNTIEGSRWHGIFVGSANIGCYSIIITDNNIRNSGNHAVLIQAATDSVINGNLIDTAGEAGIYCNNTQGLLSITGNVIRDPNRKSAATSKRGIFAGTPSLLRGTVVGNTVFDTTGNTNQPLDLSTGNNLLVYGNAVGGNMNGYPASGLPFIAPGNILLTGAFASSGLGNGAGVIGIRNATTIPSGNPTSGGILYSDGGAVKWRTSNGTVADIAGDIREVSTSYSVLASDRSILATSGAAGITVTLPAAVKGARFEIKKVDSGLGPVLVATTNGQKIDGANTKMLASQHESSTLISNGNAWFEL